MYGAEHQRLRQDRSDGSKVIYAGAQEVEVSAAGLSTVKTYWPHGIGVEIDRPGAATTELNWVHHDRLGSPVAITDQNGALKEKLAYDAWGKRRSLDGSSIADSIVGVTDNKGFTGHEMLETLELVHMHGRVYDPLVGRFMSGDPLVQDPTNGQNYNRYSYVLNNPTNLTDPTGFANADSCASGGASADCNGHGLSVKDFMKCADECRVEQGSNKASNGNPTAAAPKMQNSDSASGVSGKNQPISGAPNNGSLLDKVRDKWNDIARKDAEDISQYRKNGGSELALQGTPFDLLPVGALEAGIMKLGVLGMGAIKFIGKEAGDIASSLSKVITSGAEVTPEIIKKALQGDTTMASQQAVSLPAIRAYVDRLLSGGVAPAIQKDGEIIVEGHHRYIAGKVLGEVPAVTPGTLVSAKAANVRPISEVKIDPVDWGNR